MRGFGLALVIAVLACAPAARATGLTVTSRGTLAEPAAAIAAGSDGALWHTSDQGSGYVGRTAFDGTSDSWAAGSSADPGAIATTATSAWFIHHDHAIARADAKGVQRIYDDLSVWDLRSLAIGPDGNVWVTGRSYSGDVIGRLKPATGAVTAFGSGLSGKPQDITAGPDGALWFTEPDKDRVGRITTAGAITEYGLGISALAKPTAIVNGPDGALWFTEAAGRIGRVTTAGAIAEYPVAGKPTDITADADGALWFTLAGGLGRITTGGSAELWPTPGHDPVALASASDRGVWFADADNRKLGRAELYVEPTATPTPTPSSTPTATATETSTPTATASATPTATTTATPLPTATAVATATPTAVVTATVEPTAEPTSEPTAAPTPELQATVVLEADSGRVRVKAPGDRFRALDEAAGVPVGSVVDTTAGAVVLRSASGTGTQTGTFHGGLFQVRQSATGRIHIHLRGRLDCQTRKRGTTPESRRVGVAAKKKRKKKKRHVWGKDSGGDFSTHGRDSVTTVRGTEWLTEDRCNGTLTRVTEGKVVVKDRRTDARHVLRAGQSHLARHR